MTDSKPPLSPESTLNNSQDVARTPKATIRDLRRFAWTVAGQMVVVFAAAFTLLHGVVAYQNAKHFRGKRTEGRLRDLVAELPAIAAYPDRTIIGFGNCNMMAGLSPSALDDELGANGIRATTFNLAVGHSSPAQLLPLAERIQDAYQASHRTAALAIIEFSPNWTTKAARRFVERLTPQKAALTASAGSTWRTFRRAPLDGVELFVNRYLLGGSSPYAITTAFKAQLASEPSWWFGERSAHDPWEDLAEEEERTDPEGMVAADGFSIALRGYPNVIQPEWQRKYEALASALATPERRRIHVKRHLANFDALNIDFDEGESVHAFIETCRALKTVSETAVIVIMPINKAWYQRTPAGAERLARLIAKLEHETGLKVINFEDSSEFLDSDFFDSSHLNFTSGAPKLSRMLGRRIIDLLSPAEQRINALQ